MRAQNSRICEDILGTTRNIDRWRHDLDRLRAAGLMQLRYSVPWRRIERKRGSFGWAWMDGPLQYMRVHGCNRWSTHCTTRRSRTLQHGFDNTDFVALYCRFVREFAQRYPWVNHYTVFNEPLPTTLFCSYTGMWYPHLASYECFVRMATQVAKAMCLSAEAIQSVNPQAQFIHIHTCETHRALDLRSEPWVEFAQQRRFLMHDLVLGCVDRIHPLFDCLLQHGASADNLEWLRDHRMHSDVLGLDYCFHSEIEWCWDNALRRANISHSRSHPVGFARVAQDYVERFEVPVMLTEMNPRDRV